MNNQNAYAPGADTVLEDVLEIPRPLRSSSSPQQAAAEQMLVLEDVIPAEEFSPPDEIPGAEEEEEALLRTEATPYDATALEMSPLAGPQVYGASETSSFDYDSGRAWLRLAPLMLLLGVFVFFGLYFLGNRMGNWGNRSQEAAAKPAQPETQSAAPAAEPVKAEPATAAAAAEPAASNAPAPVATTAKEETPAPVAEQARAEAKPESKPETKPEAKPEAKPEQKPAASAPAPVAATAPAAQPASGNFTVQVGSYNNSEQADERAGRLRSGGVEARVVRAEIPRRGTWYRVQAGHFASREEAARFASELKGKGATDSFIITESQGQ